MKRSTVSRLLLAAGAAECVIAVVASTHIDRQSTYIRFLASYLAMGIPWLVACYAVSFPAADSSANRRLMWIVALILRAAFIWTEPMLSDDIYRYVWDGRVAHAGINPYLYAPDADELRHLRNENFGGINNKDIPTIYPPLMQMGFYAATAVSESIVWMKVVFVLADVATLVALVLLLRALAMSPLRAVAYAWCPLVVVESAASGHNDTLGVFLLVIALLAFVQSRPVAGITLLALSGMVKLLGFALAPLFVRLVPLRGWIAAGATSLVLCLPYAAAGTSAFEGLSQYGMRWRSNDSVFHVVFWLTGSLEIAKGIVALALVAFVLWLVAVRARPVRSTYLTIGAVLILMTTVHPWYLLWITPFLAIYLSPAWLFLCLSVQLSYHAAFLGVVGEPWEDNVFLKTLEYAPFFVIGAARFVTRYRAEGTLAGALELDSAP